MASDIADTARSALSTFISVDGIVSLGKHDLLGNLVPISKSRADGPLCPDKFALKFPGFSWVCSPTVPVLAGHLKVQ
jgi:hypothetical protein